MAGAAGAEPTAPVNPYPTAVPSEFVPAGTPNPYFPAALPAAQLYAQAAPAGPACPSCPAVGVPQAVAQTAPTAVQQTLGDVCNVAVRKPLQSDHAFDGFVGPVSNPILAKDPRANTYARFLFINNSFPGDHPFGGGTAQAYAMQVNVALTERLAFIADKDGYAAFNPRNVPATSGWLNLAAGLKYTFYRDVERQALAAVGVMYEIPSGEAAVQQNQGSGSIISFVTFGKEFRQNWHYLQTTGYYAPLRQPDGSGFIFNSFHIDRRLFGWFYPLAELNWFYYTSGGNRLPTAVGEGDGLLNFGTQGMAGNSILTGAVGGKFLIGQCLQVGAAYEFPLTKKYDIINNRLTVEVILRY